MIEGTYTAFVDGPSNARVIAARVPAGMPEEAMKFIAVRRNTTTWLPSLKYMMSYSKREDVLLLPCLMVSSSRRSMSHGLMSA